LHYETDDDDSASEDSAVLLFFFSVHREFFLIELTLMVRIFPVAMLVYIVVVDACSGKPGRCLKKMDFIQKKLKKMGTEKSRILLQITGGSNKTKAERGGSCLCLIVICI